MRKIAVITSTRADHGLLYWVISTIHNDPALTLQLIVTGTHLSHEFGFTVQEIEKDKFPIAEKIEMLLASDTKTAITASMGIAMIGFSKAYERLNPDLLVVLGDRFEILAAVAAAAPFRIPVAHIHGGESTEGAMDELFRHAITKMSHIHFPAAKKYAERIMQMGESPKNIFCFGAPGLDHIHKLRFLDKKQLSKLLGMPNKMMWGVITYHTETLEKTSPKILIREILEAIGLYPDIYWVFTLPNADTENRAIMTSLRDYVKKHSNNAQLFSSLGQVKYLSLLKHASIMVGNSSSGIMEAPSFKLPVVNIGDRQRGRLRGKNIIDVVECKKKLIARAIQKAIGEKFKASLKGMENPYRGGNVSKKIVEKLKTIRLDENLLKKKFRENKNTTRK